MSVNRRELLQMAAAVPVVVAAPAIPAVADRRHLPGAKPNLPLPGVRSGFVEEQSYVWARVSGVTDHVFWQRIMRDYETGKDKGAGQWDWHGWEEHTLVRFHVPIWFNGSYMTEATIDSFWRPLMEGVVMSEWRTGRLSVREGFSLSARVPFDGGAPPADHPLPERIGQSYAAPFEGFIHNWPVPSSNS